VICGWSPDVVAFGAAARRLIDSEVPATRAVELAQAGEQFDRALWARLVEQEWHALWDTGLVGDQLDAGVAALQAVGRRLAAVPLGSRLLSGWLLSRAPELAAVAEGSADAVAAVAFATAPDVTVQAGDSGVVIDGRVAPVIDAAVAQVLYVVVPTDEGAWVAAVGSDDAGVQVEPVQTAGRQREATVRLAACSARVTVRLDEADYRLLRALSLVTSGAQLAGAARELVDMTALHARSRRQFGSPLSGFQAIRAHLADMHTDAELMASLWHANASTLSRNEDALQSALAAWLWTREAYRRVVRRAHQVHGGVGFIRDHVLHLYFGRAQAAQGMHGSAFAQRSELLRLRRPQLFGPESVRGPAALAQR
jgi:alkylation response protein AidB-like acyl-CoA dehydrogenase